MDKKNRNSSDYPFSGDIREADCLQFLDLNSDSVVLLVGRERSYTEFTLSRMCKQVFVLEPDGSQAETEAFVAGKVFDAIIIEESAVLRARDKFYEVFIRSLKSGGEIYIAVCSLGSFRFARNLAQLPNLQDIRYYLVLPNHHTPLFFLPLYSIGAMRYFFRNLFYLIATIPPEKRGNYRFIIGIANIAAKILPVRLLAFLLRTAFLRKAIVVKKA